jgi:PiT family inorganic phosphate transporter
MAELTWILIAVVLVALIFDYTNGFHDAANAIATSIGTRALTPGVALGMAAVLNVVGGLVYETKVANTMTQIVRPGAASQELVLAALLGAIVWNLLTWWYGIPSSSSHALIGGLVGAAIGATFELESVQWDKVWAKVVLPTVASPLLGFLLAALVTTVLYRLVHGGTSVREVLVVRSLAFVLITAFFAFILHLAMEWPFHLLTGHELAWPVLGELLVAPFGAVSLPDEPWDYAIVGLVVLPAAVLALLLLRGVIGRGPSEVNGRFRLLQTLSAGFMALEHGHNDAQKTMGIITLALIAGGRITPADGVPLWVKLSCAGIIGLGTFSGGKRIIKTMGMKLVKLEPIDGFAAETVAASVIQAAGRFGMPISTTHAITAAITGVGATKRISAVRWGITIQILFAWVVTLPAAALLAALVFAAIHAIR